MLKQLKVRTRLFLLLAIMLGAILLMGIIGLINTAQFRNEIDHMYIGGSRNMKYLIPINDFYDDILVNALHRIERNPSSAAEELTKIKAAQQVMETSWNDYLQSKSYMEEHLLLLQKNIVEQINQYIKNSLNFLSRAEALAKSQEKEQFAALLINELESIVRPLVRGISNLMSLHIEDTEKDYKAALINSRWYDTFTLIILILSLLISVPLAIAIVSSIVKPLDYTVEKLNLVAEGQTSIEVEILSGGELGKLLQAVKDLISSTEMMSNTLVLISNGDLTVKAEPRSSHDVLGSAVKDLISSTETMSNTLVSISHGDLTVKAEPRSSRDVLGLAIKHLLTQMRHILGDIQGGSNTLTQSAQEIASSFAELSSGSAETAAAVTETTTTVEELKQTAELSAEKAKDVLTNVEETLQTVKASESSVSATIEDMGQINEKMRIISEGIVKLSEHSQTIGEIIDTVNDLAEQSNLLAVNAAIEAAKAGEQGKGFGVVAQEIRTLAEQSKAATIQVRSILNDIQNATSVAVLATEQGIKAAAKGVDQSTQTNTAIKALTKNMAQMTQSANQIVFSNQQQLIGVEQVSIAMANINEATSQHVEHLRQIESAVSSLTLVIGNLKKLIDQYKLN